MSREGAGERGGLGSRVFKTFRLEIATDSKSYI